MKTSGATGLHVLVPLGAQFTHEESRTLGELLARFVNREHPDISTIIRKVSARGGRVYLDFLQNRHGQTIAGPFSVRPLPGRLFRRRSIGNEVGPRLEPRSFTIATLKARLEAAVAILYETSWSFARPRGGAREAQRSLRGGGGRRE